MNIIQYLPWIEIFIDLWRVGNKAIRGLSVEGMYEVLEYESTLELKDLKGKQAFFRKREKVRYLQENIIAYQDQAWGDGRILQNYRCTPGTPVDIYRPGSKTNILISLREVKNLGNIDEFNIEWGIINGFVRANETWETEVRHRTKILKMRIIFPKGRPPLRVSLIENLLRRTSTLDQKNITRLPDGRWQVKWQTNKPKLHESYILNWKW